MSVEKRSLQDEIAAENKRLLQEFMPYLEKEVEKAKSQNGLVLCLTGQDRPPDYFPCEQAGRSNVSEIISVLQAEARINGFYLPYAYENVAIISQVTDHDKFAEEIDSARIIIERHSFGRTKQQVNITLSFGLSSYPFDSESAAELLQHAQVALESAARAGANTRRCYWKMK